jgi:hypothetical protein
MNELEPFNMQAHTQGLFDHYLRMAQNPATKAQSWLRVNELARDFPSVYADLPKLLTEAMTKETK